MQRRITGDSLCDSCRNAVSLDRGLLRKPVIGATPSDPKKGGPVAREKVVM